MEQNLENELASRLNRMSARVNEIAALEAKDAVLKGPAARGVLMPEKMRLLDKMDRILGKLEKGTSA